MCPWLLVCRKPRGVSVMSLTVGEDVLLSSNASVDSIGFWVMVLQVSQAERVCGQEDQGVEYLREGFPWRCRHSCSFEGVCGPGCL